jgi:hypothetical protein
MWQPRRLTTLWASTACYRESFTFYGQLYLYLYITRDNYRSRWGKKRKRRDTDRVGRGRKTVSEM